MEELIRTITSYPDLDLSFAEGDAAIYCECEDDLVHLIAVMKRNYPQKCEYWAFPDSSDCFHSKREFCVCLGINCDSHSNMVYGELENFKTNGFRIVQFSELSLIEDFMVSDEDQDEFSEDCINLISR